MRVFLLTKTLFIGIYIRDDGAIFFARLDLSGASGVSGAGRGERSFLENLRLFSFDRLGLIFHYNYQKIY